MHIKAILIAMLVTTPLAADAKPKPRTKAQSVKAHMNRAAKAHKAKKFEVALTELEAAYAIDPQPKLLFAIAQVQAKLDRCDGAVDNYEKFLASTKNKQTQSIVKQAIAACKTKIAAAAPAPARTPPPDDTVFRDKKPIETTPRSVEMKVADPRPPEPVLELAPEPTHVEDDAPPSLGPPSLGRAESPPSPGGTPWYKDVVGDALVVGGLAAGAASVFMYMKATGELDDAEAAGSLDQYEDGIARAHDHRTYAVIFAGAGVVLLGGGLLRYALHDRGETRPPGGVALAPTSGGAVVTWGGGF